MTPNNKIIIQLEIKRMNGFINIKWKICRICKDIYVKTNVTDLDFGEENTKMYRTNNHHFNNCVNEH